MTDIDFDELDKAVNSVLGPRATDKPEAAPSEKPAPAPSDETAPAEKKDESPKIVLTPRPRQPIASPAAKRSGRFMDMVHPSSDMASEKEKPASPAPRVRIMPTDATLKPEEPAVESPEPEEKPEETATVTPPPSSSILDAVMAPASSAPIEQRPEAKAETGEAAEPELTMESEYPDPIDVAGPLSIADEVQKGDKEAIPGDDLTEETVPAPEVPFLPDAKVEKRPLGGFTPGEEATPAMEFDAGVQNYESQLPPETSLPPALQSDVVAVESDALPESQPSVEPPEEKEHKSDDEATKDKADKPAPAEKTVHTDDGGVQSIPQQYRAEPATADEAPRPVFDTDQYHQPLIAAHAGKKNHAWVFILLVTALLAIGGTLGYFAFMSGL